MPLVMAARLAIVNLWVRGCLIAVPRPPEYSPILIAPKFVQSLGRLTVWAADFLR